jgi:putative oxidoreductase
MLQKLVNTENEYSLTLARVLLGVVLFAHGAQKMVGWFGGAGFVGTISDFAKFGLPTAVALYAIFVEFFGSLCLLFGLLSRVAAFTIIVEMIGAVLPIHIHLGLFMNWTGHQKGEGFEFHLIAIALAFLIMVKGAGALSFDYVVSSLSFMRNKERERLVAYAISRRVYRQWVVKPGSLNPLPAKGVKGIQRATDESRSSFAIRSTERNYIQ